MTLDWSTFFLQIINFLALVWILKHFLYKPILATLAQRRAAIAKTLEQAQAAEARANALRTDFENRLTDWAQQKAMARAAFDSELEAERMRQTEALNQTLASESERHAALEARQREALQRSLEAEALTQGGQFVSALLARLAGPELEAKLVELFLADLPGLSASELASLRANPPQASVSSAFPLSTGQREALAAALAAQLGVPVMLSFSEDPALLAGLRIALGAWQLNLSLADELRFYTRSGEQAG